MTIQAGSITPYTITATILDLVEWIVEHQEG